jgi:hypothetical protein
VLKIFKNCAQIGEAVGTDDTQKRLPPHDCRKKQKKTILKLDINLTGFKMTNGTGLKSPLIHNRNVGFFGEGNDSVTAGAAGHGQLYRTCVFCQELWSIPVLVGRNDSQRPSIMLQT